MSFNDVMENLEMLPRAVFNSCCIATRFRFAVNFYNKLYHVHIYVLHTHTHTGFISSFIQPVTSCFHIPAVL
jgi:hypothetical protein